jgi:nucleoside diphosphate kinase
MNLEKRSRRKSVSFSIFEEYHETLLNLEHSYHSAGIAIELYESINEKMEKVVVLINSITKEPYKTVVLEGKNAWQVIKDVVEQVREDKGYEAPGSLPAELRSWITKQMNANLITESHIAQKAHCSISFVSHLLKGRRNSENILTAIAELLGYKTIGEMIAASRGHDGGKS